MLLTTKYKWILGSLMHKMVPRSCLCAPHLHVLHMRVGGNHECFGIGSAKTVTEVLCAQKTTNFCVVAHAPPLFGSPPTLLRMLRLKGECLPCAHPARYFYDDFTRLSPQVSHYRMKPRSRPMAASCLPNEATNHPCTTLNKKSISASPSQLCSTKFVHSN